MSTAPADIETLKARMRATWSAGDFGVIAKQIQGEEEELIGRLNIKPGMKVLDVACGTGNTAIPAARRGADVIGVDIAPNLLEQARARAKAEDLGARFEEGDAEQLRFKDGAFDLVISVFGAMFAPRPERVASELTRVCRSGGRIVMASWTPESFTGRSFQLASKYVPPPPGLPPPILWGDEATVRERLRDGIANIEMHRRVATFRLPFGESEVVDYYRRYSGPTIRTFEALDAAGQAAYRKEYEALWKANNRATDGTLEVPSEYLEIIATRA